LIEENPRLKYKVDLSSYLADGEANYFRLKKIFPQMHDAKEKKILIFNTGKHILLLKVLEITRYTTLIMLSEETGEYMPCKILNSWLTLPQLTMRLYHDARMAEVISCDGARYIRPRYEKLNKNMYQPDEKSQWNRFLSECLEYCLEYGYDNSWIIKR
jgi:uncharacterized protein YqiB (DUF1249 family)|tara:strand:- start:309 stop:782 length:474 start_codon:yes stop_codon:yes gene_type:complete